MRDQVKGAMLESEHFEMFCVKTLNLEHNYGGKEKWNCGII